MSEFVLDTSIIRSVKAEILKSATRRHRLRVSPITIYELLSHLSDDDEDGAELGTGYRKARGRLLVCSNFELLEDPVAEVCCRAGFEEVPHSSRFEEVVVLQQTLENLEQCESLEEYAETTVSFPNGDEVSCADQGSRVDKHLKRLERDYEENVRKQYNMVLGLLGNRSPDDLSPHEFHWVIQKSVLVLSNNLVVGGSPDADVQARVYSAFVRYIGYITARALSYAKKAQPGQQINVCGNDYEDGLMCLHLDLCGDRILATNDKGTEGALRRTSELLTSYFEEVQIQATIDPGVVLKDKFKEMIA